MGKSIRQEALTLLRRISDARPDARLDARLGWPDAHPNACPDARPPRVHVVIDPVLLNNLRAKTLKDRREGMNASAALIRNLQAAADRGELRYVALFSNSVNSQHYKSYTTGIVRRQNTGGKSVCGWIEWKRGSSK